MSDRFETYLTSEPIEKGDRKSLSAENQKNQANSLSQSEATSTYHVVFYCTYPDNNMALTIIVMKKGSEVFFKQNYTYDGLFAIEGNKPIKVSVTDCKMMINSVKNHKLSIQEDGRTCTLKFEYEVASNQKEFVFDVKRVELNSIDDIHLRLSDIEEKNKILKEKFETKRNKFQNLVDERQFQITSIGKADFFEIKNIVESPDLSILSDNDIIFNGYSLTKLQHGWLKHWLEVKALNVKPIYSANSTLDGFKAETFHKTCDTLNNLLVVVEANGKIFGGFSKEKFGHEDKPNIHDTSGKSFIFSFSSGVKFSLNPFFKDYCAIYSKENLGPTFGSFLGIDLEIKDDCNLNDNTSHLGQCYELGDTKFDNNSTAKNYLSGEEKFKVTNIEYYQLEFGLN